MPLPSSPDPISASQIKNEFGTNNSPRTRIGQYRDATTHGGKKWPFDVDIPIGTGPNDTTTTIRFSDFRGKQRNIITVIEGGTENRIVAADKPKAVVGGLKTSTTKSVRAKSRNIIYIVNKTIGSAKGDRKKCALRTGTSNAWFGSNDSTFAKVNIELGEGAKIYGAGGDGGDGKGHETDGKPGGDGSSGLGIQVATESIVIKSGAIIVAGGAGGGGGGGGREDSAKVRKSGGGGGGGGAGLPAGKGGEGGGGNKGADGDPGSDGTLEDGGGGGNGKDNENQEEARSGGGGGGGSVNGSDGQGGQGGNPGEENGFDGEEGEGGKGGDGNGKDGESNGGGGGEKGYAITSSGNLAINVTVGSSRVKGSQQQNGGVS